MGVRLEMRVDMRRWALVLCSIGVMGGGCSARALISVGLTVPQGTGVLTGKPQIHVEWDDVNVRSVVGRDPIEVRDAPATHLGVYLDYEGSIKVSATVQDGDDCAWSGESMEETAVRGERTEVEIELTKVDPGCPAARPDAGAPIAEAGVDGPAPTDVRPSVLPDGGAPDADGGEDTAATIAACQDYCTTYLKNCADWRESPLIQGDCVLQCNHWPAGGPASTGENTLACRRTFLTATNAPELRCSTCIAASPESPGMCNSLPPDAAPRGDCRIPPLPDGGDGP